MKSLFLFLQRSDRSDRLFAGIGFLVVVLFGLNANATNLRMEVVPQYGTNPLMFDQLGFTNSTGQTLSVTRLEFLLSDLALHQKNGQWVTKNNWQAFVSLNGKRNLVEAYEIPAGEYDRVRFNVGLTPEINHSKTAQYPSDHPLNPNLNGLYWGWSGGYVFFAVEGHWLKGKESSGYSFHLGNDWMLTPIELPVALSDPNQSLRLTLDTKPLFDFALTDETSSTHSRKNDDLAPRLQKSLTRAFSISMADHQLANNQAEKKPSESFTPPPTTHPYRFTFSAQFPMPELPRDNPLSEEGVELGHRLFGEKLLSINNQQSCASCHREENAFSDPRTLSPGAEGQVGNRHAMPIFNLAWKKTFFWDGRANSVREQVLQPIQNPIEMHETLDRVVKKLSETKFYPAEFQKVFGTFDITAERVAKALEQFVFSQLSYNSKFDRAIEGKEELTEEEKRGFQLFMTEYDPRREQYGADCFHCHGGALFQSQSFANNGLDAESKDLGRFLATQNEGDKGKFAVPSLRNVEVTTPYMHDGRFKTLEEVIEHYATGVKRSATLDPNIAKHPVGGVPLNDADKKALVAFLKTLTDAKFKTLARK